MAPVMFLVDGMLSGTGIRDTVRGGYVEPERLGLTARLKADLNRWVSSYEDAHYQGFPPDIVSELDREGVKLSVRIGDELPKAHVGYFSNGLMKRLV